MDLSLNSSCSTLAPVPEPTILYVAEVYCEPALSNSKANISSEASPAKVAATCADCVRLLTVPKVGVSAGSLPSAIAP